MVEKGLLKYEVADVLVPASEMFSRRRKVVVENSDWRSALAQMAALGRAGFSVTCCSGPQALPGSGCPVVEGARCAWLEMADVVLYDLDLDDPMDEEVLRALRRDYPELPVVLEVPESTARDHAALLGGCHVIRPFDMDNLVRAVTEAATAARPDRP